MPFKKYNTIGAKRQGITRLGETIAFRGREGQWTALKAVPDWHNRMRDYADILIQETTDTIAFQGRKGQRDLLKDVPDWRNRLRDYIDTMIAEAEAK